MNWLCDVDVVFVVDIVWWDGRLGCVCLLFGGWFVFDFGIWK